MIRTPNIRMGNNKKKNKAFLKTFDLDLCFKSLQDEIDNLIEKSKVIIFHMQKIEIMQKEIEKELKAKTRVVLTESDCKKIIETIKNDRK